MISLLNAWGALFSPILAPPAPTGPFPVGFGETVLVDATRSRTVSLEVWYPASSLDGTIPEPFSTLDHNAVLSKYQGIPGFLLSVRSSQSYRNAPPLAGRHPVVLFNHGYPSYARQNFSQMQELASHGYVVIALGHPGESLGAKDAAGNFVEVDLQNPAYKNFQATQKDSALPVRIAQALRHQRKAKTLAEFEQASLELTHNTQFSFLQDMLKNWIEDNHFVLNVVGSSTAPDLLNTADPNKVVVMGHSFGGVAALELGKNPPAGVRGVIDLDGPWLLYPGQAQTFLQVPALMMPSTQNIFSGQDMGLHGTFGVPARVGNQKTSILEIAGTGHFNFSDLNYFPILKLFSPILGDANNLQMGSWMNQAIVEFLHRVNLPNAKD